MGWIGLSIQAMLLLASDASGPSSPHRLAAVSSPTPPPILRLTDARSRRYRSALRDAASGAPNFAGRYVLVQIGCGSSCIEVAAIDRFTGKVVWFPATISGWPLEVIEPLSFRRNSRLLTVQGMLDERPPSTTHRYRFEGQNFRALKGDRFPR